MGKFDRIYVRKLESPREALGPLRTVSEAELSRFILRGLISYHERMTMCRFPEGDPWKDGLQFALDCVNEKIDKDKGGGTK